MLTPILFTATVVLCDFLYVVFPFVPNVTTGWALSILLIIVFSVILFPAMSVALTVIVWLFVFIITSFSD